MFQKFDKNTQGRDFVIGDIHGMFDMVEQLMDQVKFDPAVDRMFSVGDLVDRGPRSREADNWCKQPWFHAIRGNHEQMAMDVFDSMYDLSGWKDPTETVALHIWNGGGWFHELDGDRQARAVNAFKQLPIAIEVETDNGRVGIVHAEVPDDDWNSLVNALLNNPANLDHYLHYAMWSRDIMKKNVRFDVPFRGVANIDMVVVGHSVVKDPLSVSNIMYLDTGAYQGKSLSMVCIQGSDEGKVFIMESDWKWERTLHNG